MTMSRDQLNHVRRIVTHAHCPDGLAAAMILHAALPEAEVVFCQYEQLPALDPAVPTLFCDIAPDKAQAERFLASGSIVLDHHPTGEGQTMLFAAAGRGRYADKERDPGVTGALLAYREVYCVLLGSDAAVGEFAATAGVRDAWMTGHPSWETACAQAEALMFYECDHFLGRPERPYLLPAEREVGAVLRSRKLIQAREMAQGLYHAHQPPYRVGLFNDAAHGFRWTSDVAEAARRLELGLDIVAGYYYRVEPDGELRLHYSMRAIRDADVQSLGEKYGGGGHKAAAGFSVTTGLHMNTDPNREIGPANAAEIGRLDPVSAFTLCIAYWHASRGS